MKSFYVYIMANHRNGTLYVGMTSNLIQRVTQHKNNEVAGFTARYHIHTLVYYEACDTAAVAIKREKQLKRWERAWKIALIEECNPTWNDLSADF